MRHLRRVVVCELERRRTRRAAAAARLLRERELEAPRQRQQPPLRAGGGHDSALQRAQQRCRVCNTTGSVLSVKSGRPKFQTGSQDLQSRGHCRDRSRLCANFIFIFCILVYKFSTDAATLDKSSIILYSLYMNV